MISFIVSNEEITRPRSLSIFDSKYLNEKGWGNGYVAIPKSANHPWFGKKYDDIPVNIHGGLTFARSTNEYNWDREWDEEHWIIGFDTSHGGDGPHLDKEWLEQETKRLLTQMQILSAVQTAEFYRISRCPYCNFVNEFKSVELSYSNYEEINCELCTKLYYANKKV